ncbi:MAG: hypothetical protein RLZZ502_42 [Pseudomonadota bacterium]|jgi:uncharacterized protein YceH (UPF0502 family)
MALERLLTPLECRIWAVLFEKQFTVPDSYPLSLNALQNGCNQKSARALQMDASEAEIRLALDTLIHANLVLVTSGGRVDRYAQNGGRVLQIPQQSVAILATLILRGPQTTAEIRINAERLHAFADVSAVQGFLDELSAKELSGIGSLVVLLPKAPGAREARWAHCLCGAPETMAATNEEAQPLHAHDVSALDTAVLRTQVAQLAERVAMLERQLSKVCDELGIA